MRDACFLKVLFQVSIDEFATLVGAERSLVSLRLRINLSTERFDEVGCIRLFMEEVQLRVAGIVLYEGWHVLTTTQGCNSEGSQKICVYQVERVLRL